MYNVKLTYNIERNEWTNERINNKSIDGYLNTQCSRNGIAHKYSMHNDGKCMKQIRAFCLMFSNILSSWMSNELSITT